MKSTAFGMRGSGEMAAFAVTPLIHDVGGMRRSASDDGNISAACFPKKPIYDFGAGLGVAEGGGYAENLEFGTLESERQGEGVVNVIADVGINDYSFWRGRRLRRLLSLRTGNWAQDNCKRR